MVRSCHWNQVDDSRQPICVYLLALFVNEERHQPVLKRTFWNRKNQQLPILTTHQTFVCKILWNDATTSFVFLSPTRACQQTLYACELTFSTGYEPNEYSPRVPHWREISSSIVHTSGQPWRKTMADDWGIFTLPASYA